MAPISPKCLLFSALTDSKGRFFSGFHRYRSWIRGFPQAHPVARRELPTYLFGMRPWCLLFVVPALAMIAVGLAAATDREPVPLYTGEDLDRMFGPAPAGPSHPVDKTRPEDWRWVEQFLDREYARIDADRQYDLSSRQVDISARRVERPSRIYGGSLLWGGGYPAAWWNGAGGRDSGPQHSGARAPSGAYRNPYAQAMGEGAWGGGIPRGGSSHRNGQRSK